eukprot:TRINITY_DN25069_c0_g1_i1.p1 TRINITY_DN25069_c0_g1~~TRINITY_DN25069_c0_g1_i1.p1  ORF type:complete len:379 (-),score=72.88 TRINITY_DN25069_c0_g1_i1:237-1373(-)
MASSGDKWKGEPPEYAEVALSVYELYGTAGVGMVVGKLYHVGVEVYWLEWSYGAGDAGTGVFPCQIGECTLGRFEQRVPLGRTPYTPQGVLRIIGEMRPQFQAQDYELLSRNCQVFSIMLCKKLRVDPVPGWVTETLEKFGEVDTTVRPQAASGGGLPGMDDEDLKDLAGSGDWEAAVEMRWRQCQEFVHDRAEAAIKASRVEELVLELSYPYYYSETVASLTKNPRFRDALQRAAAEALKVDISAENEDDWLNVIQVAQHSGNLLKARMRLHSAPHAPDKWPPKMPHISVFSQKFVASLKRHIKGGPSWPKWSAELVLEVDVRTAPGMKPFGTYVETQRGTGGSILFAPDERKPSTDKALVSGVQRLQRVLQWAEKR